jgi:acyl-coenzyme A thioesterase PaaI-like protein
MTMRSHQSAGGFMHSLRYKLINWYPPLLGAGIHVLHRESDEHTIKVRMKLTRLNINAVGVHFGGSLYAMCDPFFMLILMQHLGRDYIVWDKAASIQFVKPGKGTVFATFHVPPETIAEIRAQADRGEKLEPVFSVNVVDAQGEIIAQVEKRLYVRKKKQT